MFDRVQFRRRNLRQGREFAIEGFQVGSDRHEQRTKIVAVNPLGLRVGGELLMRILQWTGVDLHLIERLYGKAAGEAARPMAPDGTRVCHR